MQMAIIIILLQSLFLLATTAIVSIESLDNHICELLGVVDQEDVPEINWITTAMRTIVSLLIALTITGVLFGV